MSTRMRRFWKWWVLAALLMAVCARLGVWQLHRKAEKEAMLAQVQAQVVAKRAVPLVAAFDAAKATAFEWSAGACTFDPAHVVLLDNQLNEGQAGVRAFLPCSLAAPSGSVLVEMGWYPLGTGRAMPVVSVPALSQVAGLLLPPPSGGLVADREDAGARGVTVVTRIDPATLKVALGATHVAPRILRLDPDIHVGGKRDMHVFPSTMPPEKHLAYAVQWFALAAAIFVVTLLLTLRARKP